MHGGFLGFCSKDSIIMLDDDISACVCMVSLRCRKLSPDEIARAEEMRTFVEGFSKRVTQTAPAE